MKSEKNSMYDIILLPKQFLPRRYRTCYKNILTCIQIHFIKGTKRYVTAKNLKIGKDRVYRYYKLFKEGFSPIEIFENYIQNRKTSGKNKVSFPQEKIDEIQEKLEGSYSVDSICGRDELLEARERCSTKTLYRMVDEGIFDKTLLRRKGKRKATKQEEKRGKINDCKTIHERDFKYPNAKINLEPGHFEGDTIVGKNKKSAIVTLVDKVSKYIVLIVASRKSLDVLNGIKNWSYSTNISKVKSITFDEGKEFAKWKEMEVVTGAEFFF